MKCKSLKKDGNPCSVEVLRGSEYCFFHDPDKAEERYQASRSGGLQKSITFYLKRIRQDLEKLKQLGQQELVTEFYEEVSKYEEEEPLDVEIIDDEDLLERFYG